MILRNALSVAVLSVALVGATSPVFAAAGEPQDPFARPVPKRPEGGKRPGATPSAEIAPPPLAERQKECGGASSGATMSSDTSPCPYLVRELTITGLFEGDRPGAIAVVGSAKQTLFLHVGDRLYDAVVEKVILASETQEAAVVFRQTTNYQGRKGRESKVNLVTVPVTQ